MPFLSTSGEDEQGNEGERAGGESAAGQAGWAQDLGSPWCRRTPLSQSSHYALHISERLMSVPVFPDREKSEEDSLLGENAKSESVQHGLQEPLQRRAPQAGRGPRPAPSQEWEP